MESNPEVLAKGDDAWTTGNAFDMLVDEDEQGGAGDMEDVGMKSAEAAPKQKGVGGEASPLHNCMPNKCKWAIAIP